MSLATVATAFRVYRQFGGAAIGGGLQATTNRVRVICTNVVLRNVLATIWGSRAGPVDQLDSKIDSQIDSQTNYLVREEEVEARICM